MSRTCISPRGWVMVLVTATAVHAGGIVLCASCERSRSAAERSPEEPSPTEAVGALFERQFAELEGGNHAALWRSLSVRARKAIIEVAPRLPSSHRPDPAVLDRSRADVDVFPEVDLDGFIRIVWDGTAAYNVEIEDSEARVVYPNRFRGGVCELLYTRVGKTWYLDRGGTRCVGVAPSGPGIIRFGPTGDETDAGQQPTSD